MREVGFIHEIRVSFCSFNTAAIRIGRKPLSVWRMAQTEASDISIECPTSLFPRDFIGEMI